MTSIKTRNQGLVMRMDDLLQNGKNKFTICPPHFRTLLLRTENSKHFPGVIKSTYFDVLLLICGYCLHDGSCKGSDKYLSERVGVSIPTIKRILLKLEQMKYIKRKTRVNKIRTVKGKRAYSGGKSREITWRPIIETLYRTTLADWMGNKT